MTLIHSQHKEIVATVTYEVIFSCEINTTVYGCGAFVSDIVLAVIVSFSISYIHIIIRIEGLW